MQEKIDQILGCMPDCPSQHQINKAFEDLHEFVLVCFGYDKNGSLFQIKDVKQLVNGQAVLSVTDITTFPNFYYDDQFLVDQIRASGLHIDQTENIFTEERRTRHNSLNPKTKYGKDFVDHPLSFLYHISKPT